LLLFACGADPGAAATDGGPRDAARPADSLVRDSAMRMESRGPADASPAPRDAPRAVDGTQDGPTFGPCSAAGSPGTCIDVSECTGNRVATPGLCPGPASIQCCHAPRDGGPGADGSMAGMCDPDVRPTPNTGRAEAPGEGRCPPGMLPVEAFCVDRYEAFVVEVLADGVTTAPLSPFHNPGTRRIRALSVAGAIPQGYISGRQAGAACAEAGKRLCTNQEWLRACRGPSNLTFPYGNTRMTGVCNDHRAVHPAVELFPNDPNPFSRIQNACINQLHDSLDPAGARAGCVTGEGALDMMGNLHEWTSDPAGTFRGGFYVDTVVNGPGCLYATTAHDTGHWDYSTGFRCCADPL
jgi:hypothetical protein